MNHSILFQLFASHVLFPAVFRIISIFDRPFCFQFRVASPFQALQFAPLPISVPIQAYVTSQAPHAQSRVGQTSNALCTSRLIQRFRALYLSVDRSCAFRALVHVLSLVHVHDRACMFDDVVLHGFHDAFQ